MSRLARARGAWEEILLAEQCLRSQVKEGGVWGGTLLKAYCVKESCRAWPSAALSSVAVIIFALTDCENIPPLPDLFLLEKKLKMELYL